MPVTSVVHEACVVEGGVPSPWLRHKLNRGWRANKSRPYDFDEGDQTGAFYFLGARRRDGLAAQ